MKTERAIEILDPEHREHYESIEPVNEACRMGMEALKKQISKRPYYAHRHVARCQACDYWFEKNDGQWCSKYCPNCGQALDWSEEQ